MSDLTSSAAPPTIHAEAIANLLSMSPAYFMRQRAILMQNGMPRPIPGTMKAWSRKAIMQWIDGGCADQGAGVERDTIESISAKLEGNIERRRA